jgi:hypothetical protein
MGLCLPIITITPLTFLFPLPLPVHRLLIDDFHLSSLSSSFISSLSDSSLIETKLNTPLITCFAGISKPGIVKLSGYYISANLPDTNRLYIILSI